MSQSIFDIIRNNPEYNQKNSLAWYQRNVRDIYKGMSVQKFMGDNLAIQSSRFIPGQLIQFFYSAKGADKLPYWDTAPLVLPFSKTATHFTGLNLHYLHPRYRLLLLNKLMNYVTDDSLTPRTRFRVSWQLLKNVSKFPEVSPCVKQYIIGRVKSKYLIINPTDWPIACVLPSERFRGAQSASVFRQSTLSVIENRVHKHG